MGRSSFFTNLFSKTHSTKRRYELLAKKLADAKAAKIDDLESLKEEIKRQEAQLCRKKSEWEQSKGPSRQLTGTEIEMLFRAMDRMSVRQNVLVGDIERISIAQTKVIIILGHADDRERHAVDEDGLTDILLDVQELFDDLKAADRAARDLEKEKYETPWAAAGDKEERLSEITGERESSSGLSAETEKRLKELETE